MTTTSEIPYLPLLSPHPPQTMMTPRSARSRTPLRQSLSPPKQRTPSRLILPTKARSSPSKSHPPRKSPIKLSSFCAINSKAVSFTPQRTKQPPRAWERRPATPYVPRGEKQKIWKRVPLVELGVDASQPAGVSRRDVQNAKDYARVVKKLKVGHEENSQDEDDKENTAWVAVDAKVDDEEAGLRKKTRGGVNFVTMRVEADEIVGSPKKKLRTPVAIEDTGNDTEDEDLDKEEDYQEDGMAVESSWSNEHRERLPEVQQDEMQQARVALADETDTEAEPTFSNMERVSDNSVGGTVTDGGLPAEGTTTYSLLEELSELNKGAALQNGQQDHVVRNHGDESAEEGHWLPAQSVEAIEARKNTDMSMSAIESNNVLPAGAERISELPSPTGEPRSSSPPTILGEHVVVDELASKLSSEHTKREAEKGVASESELPLKQDTGPGRISDDDTAFLRDFMSRTKAEKAAREQGQQQQQSFREFVPSAMTAVEQTNARALSDMASSPPRFPIPEPQHQNEGGSGSPLRRSKRAIITAIPRPQNLPNAIQLKRANGTEFIFTANKSTSAANVVIATRANTKKNKGSALCVSDRLEQLLAERTKAEENGQTEPNPASIVTTDKASKKRKRDKNDKGKVKKTLTWDDENLVQYQEAEKLTTNDGWEDIEDSSQEDDEPEKFVKLTLTMSSVTPSISTSPPQEETPPRQPAATEQEPTEKESSSSQNKVRRVRRGIVGSVNGTPGPKTRSKKVTDGDETDTTSIEVTVEEEKSLESSVAASVAITTLAAAEEKTKVPVPSVTRKSRMPVPSSARKGAAASASIRTACALASSAPIGRGTIPPGTDSEERSKVAGTEKGAKEGEKGDLLGRRRLRVRS